MPALHSPAPRTSSRSMTWLATLLIGFSAISGLPSVEVQVAAAPPVPSSDDVAPPSTGTPGGLIGGLRSLIQSNSILSEEEDVSNGLLEQLDQAAGQMDQIRQSNRQAIRQANRQPRTGQHPGAPNLVLIQLERMPFRDPSQIPADELPNFRRLVSDGLFFTRHYAASPDLSIARKSLLSGRNPALSDLNTSAGLDDSRLLPGVLWKGGYATGLIGQWDDSTLPTRMGFDEWVGFPSRKEATAYPSAVSIDSTQMTLSGNAGGQNKVHAIDLFATESVHFLERHRNERRPFFLMVCFPDLQIADDPSAARQARERTDRAIGRIVAALDQLRLRPNTCILLTSESGMAPTPGEPVQLPSGERSFAHGLGEGNLHIPLCVCWPGQIAPGVTDHLSVSWDLLPSLLDLTTTQSRPSGLAGISWTPLLRKQKQPAHKLIYWATADRNAQAVHQGDWKGVHLKQSPGVQLYQLRQDPGETTDLAADHPDIIKGMLARQ